jgi:hypothetical protein
LEDQDSFVMTSVWFAAAAAKLLISAHFASLGIRDAAVVVVAAR